MLEILKFIFSSFWIWAGTVVLLAITADAVASVLAIILNAARRLPRRKDN